MAVHAQAREGMHAWKYINLIIAAKKSTKNQGMIPCFPISLGQFTNNNYQKLLNLNKHKNEREITGSRVKITCHITPRQWLEVSMKNLLIAIQVQELNWVAHKTGKHFRCFQIHSLGTKLLNPMAFVNS